MVRTLDNLSLEPRSFTRIRASKNRIKLNPNVRDGVRRRETSSIAGELSGL